MASESKPKSRAELFLARHSHWLATFALVLICFGFNSVLNVADQIAVNFGAKETMPVLARLTLESIRVLPVVGLAGILCSGYLAVRKAPPHKLVTIYQLSCLAFIVIMAALVVLVLFNLSSPSGRLSA